MEQLVVIVLAGCTIAAAFGKQPDGRMEAKLLTAMQEATQHVVEDHIYTDMDHDGKKEMVGAYRDEKGGCSHLFQILRRCIDG